MARRGSGELGPNRRLPGTYSGRQLLPDSAKYRAVSLNAPGCTVLSSTRMPCHCPKGATELTRLRKVSKLIQKERARRYTSLTEMRRARARLNLEAPIPIAQFADFVGDYRIKREQFVRSQLVDERGKCKREHGRRYVAQLISRPIQNEVCRTRCTEAQRNATSRDVRIVICDLGREGSVPGVRRPGAGIRELSQPARGNSRSGALRCGPQVRLNR